MKDASKICGIPAGLSVSLFSRLTIYLFHAYCKFLVNLRKKRE